MKEIVRYLDGVKAKKGLSSDRDLARRLGISSPALVSIRRGNSVPSDETCLRIAELAGDRPEVVLAIANQSRAPEASRAAWERILRAVVNSTLVGILALAALPSPTQAGAQQTFDSRDIMSNRRRDRNRSRSLTPLFV